MAASWTKYFDPESVTRLAHIGFKPSGLVEGHLVGNHRSPFHGFAIEFAGHRGYVPGDDIRHLDWTAYYKTDKYLLKQYEQETNFVAHLLVDVSASMQFEHKHGSKRDYAAFIATALAQLVVNQSDSVGVTLIPNSFSAILAAKPSAISPLISPSAVPWATPSTPSPPAPGRCGFQGSS